MVDKEKSISTESLLKFLSATYIFLLAAGFVYSYSLYKPFGIIISEYIELNDILLLFLPLLTERFVLILPMVVGFYVMYKLLFLKYDKQWQEKQSLELRRLVLNFFWFWLATVIVISVVVWIADRASEGLIGLILMGMMMFSPYLLERLFLFFEETHKISIAKTFRETLYIFLIFIAVMLWSSLLAVRKIKHKSGLRSFEITFKNSDVFKSDSSTYYLGRTRNYLFIYDYKIEKARVLNVDDIKEIIISKN